MIDIDQSRDKDGNLPAHAWPGGYPIFYFTADGGALCPDCANCDEEKRAEVEAGVVNWEDPELYCDNCNKRIESAYAEEESNV